MGNQEIKSAMSRITSADFDVSQLESYEQKLWREQSRDQLSGYQSHLNMNGKSMSDFFPIQSKLDIEQSGIESDTKRYSDSAKDCWQTGFSTGQKKLETLKNGDFRQVVIPSNLNAQQFEESMQHKIMIFSGMYYGRLKEDDQNQEDFFEYVEKYIRDAQDTTSGYKNALTQTFLATADSMPALLTTHPHLVKSMVQQLLAASAKIAPQSLFGTTQQNFEEDLVHQRIRKMLLSVIFSDQKDGELDELCIRLLLRFGMARASAEDLLLAAQLQSKFNIDISEELESFCRISEIFRKPNLESSDGDYSRQNVQHIQSRVSFDRGGDRSQDHDQMATDGDYWYIYNDQRGMSKGSKNSDNGQWSCQNQHDDRNLREVTMTVHKDWLLVRHAGAPNVPFEIFDKNSLRKSDDAQPFYLAEGEAGQHGDYLKWTDKENHGYEPNAAEGNRWFRASPMYSNGEHLFMLVRYHESDYNSRVVKVVLETYEIEGKKMKRIEETVLLKNNNGQRFTGSRKQYERGYLSRGSIACNGSILLWHSANYMHVFDTVTGIRRKKEHYNSTNLISCYDPRSNYYFQMDSACYSWLKRFQLSGYKPLQPSKKLSKELPDLPIVFQTDKDGILARIAAEKEARAEEQEPPPYSVPVFAQLARNDDSLALYKPPEEEKKRDLRSPEDISETCLALILSKMGCEAQMASYKISVLEKKKRLTGEQKLPFFKFPYAVYCSESYFLRVRQALEEHLDILEDGRVDQVKQSNVLNLMHIFQANIDCLVTCGIEMKKLLSTNELKQIRQFQLTRLDRIELYPGQEEKEHADLEPKELLQLYLVAAANKLNSTLELNLDAESRTEKLLAIEKNLTGDVSADDTPDAKRCLRVLPLLGSKKSMRDIFDGSEEELEIAKRVIQICFDHYTKTTLGRFTTAIEDKNFDKAPLEISGAIAAFMRAFCEGLMSSLASQLLAILDNGDVRKEGALSQEQQAKLKKLHEAEARKKVLEELIYAVWILASESYKQLLTALSDKIDSAKIYEWAEDTQIASFYHLINRLFGEENSLQRVILSFNLFMCSHKPGVTWLDEVAEGLRNCAEGLEQYIVMVKNTNFLGQKRLKDLDTFLRLVDESQRAICYSIGAVSYRLMLLSNELSEEQKKVQKMNILQGGIEAHFIPSLTQETKTQIEGSFKITQNRALQQLALQSEGEVVLSASDTLINAVLEPSNDAGNAKVEMAVNCLQQGLLMKRPPCLFARLGGAWGMPLARAAFAVTLKHSDSVQGFAKLMEDVERTGADIGDAQQGDQKAKAIVTQLQSQGDDNFAVLLAKWESASQMRQWTQKVKLTVSERITAEVELALREELTLADPNRTPFTEPFNEEHKKTIDERFGEKFDKEIEAKYQEVIKKAKFLVKLAVPKPFIEAKKKAQAEIMRQVKQGLAARFGQGLSLFKNRSTVEASTDSGLSVEKSGALSARASETRRGTFEVLDTQIKRKKTVLIQETGIEKKDKEFDWRDRLKNWKQMQQTEGAVTGFDEQLKTQSNSVAFSVLGCLQAPMDSEKLAERIEASLVGGLRRSAGLHLLNFAINLSYNSTRVFDLIQWFQGALRNNRVQQTHYLNNLEGCGITAEANIQKQFFQIITRVVHILKHERLETSTDYVHLLNALCWNFSREDHEYLVQLDLFNALHVGDGSIMHPLYRAWGQENTNFSLKLEKTTSLSLASRLRQVFEFLTQTILESIFVKRETEKVDLGQDQKMMVRQESVNLEAQETLLTEITKIFLANIERYLTLQKTFEPDRPASETRRFEPSQDESAADFTRYAFDVADYINKSGGEQVVFGRQKMQRHINDRKAQMFIARVREAGEIDPNSELATLIRTLTQSCSMAAHTLQASVEAVCARKLEAMTAIHRTSWEALGLTEPTNSLEVWSEVTGIDIEEMRKVAPSLVSEADLAAIRQSEAEAERKEAAEKQGEEAAKQTAESAPATDTAAASAAPADAAAEETKAAAESTEKAAEETKAAAAAPEEEKKEEEKEDDGLTEAERAILQESDARVRGDRYLDFLSQIKKIDPNAADDADAGPKVQGHMYTEASLYRILQVLDQILSLATVGTEGFQVIARLTEPDNLKSLIELSVEASMQNQFLIQRMLQSILKLDLPQEVLDAAVRAASQRAPGAQKANHVERILDFEASVQMEGSIFLQFLFNRLEQSRAALYLVGGRDKPGVNSVIAETVRTVRTLYTEGRKNNALRKIVNGAFVENLFGINDASEGEIDSIMSFIPETSFQRLAIGAPAMTKDGKVFSVLGVFQSEYQNSKYHDIPLQPNYSTSAQCLSLAGLYYDPASPERQDILMERMIHATPLLDLDGAVSAEAARLSVFMDEQAMESLMGIVLIDESQVTKPKAKKALSLLQTFVTRGLYNMTRTLKGEYITFLQTFDLLARFLQFLFKVASQMSVDPDESLVSSLLLELRADYLREAVTTNDKYTFQDLTASSGAPVFSSGNGSQMYILRSEEAKDIFHFTFDAQFGPLAGQYFEGSLVDSNPIKNNNGIFLVEGAKLTAMNQETLIILKHASMVITDQSADFPAMFKALKKKIQEDPDEWQGCFKTRFMVLSGADDMPKIQAIIATGSTHFNEDKTDRGYFLGQLFVHLSAEIWEKISKGAFRKKYADFDREKNFEDLTTSWAPYVLSQLIQQKFSQDQSFMVQLYMTEILDRIRSGRVHTPAPPEEETKGAEAPESSEAKPATAAEEGEAAEAEAPAKKGARAAGDQELQLCDFTALLTRTEKLQQQVRSDFQKAGVPSKPSIDTYQQAFKSIIFKDNLSPEDISESYQHCLKTLRQSYSRQILLHILSNGDEGLDAASVALISEEKSFKKLCELVHNDYMTASHLAEYHGNTLLKEQSAEQTKKLLQFMKGVPGFRSYFAQDLINRARATVERASDDDFAKLDMFTLKTFRKATEGISALDPHNLTFFANAILELGYVDEGAKCKTALALFELTLGYALIFKKYEDYYLSLDLFKQAKNYLTVFDGLLFASVDASEANADLLIGLFNSKLVQCLAGSLSLGDDTLSEREKITVEMIVNLVKTHDRALARLQRDVPIGFEMSDLLRKTLKVYKVMEQGPSFELFLSKKKFGVLLNSADAKKIYHLARNYTTSHKLFDGKFSKIVTATDCDLIIRVDKQTSKDLIQLQSGSGQVLADVNSFKTGRKLMVRVPKGQAATVEFPVRPLLASFAGRLYCRSQDYTVEHAALTRIQETAECAAVRVYAMQEAALFVGGDESLWGIGYRAQGSGRDKCRLRRIEAPDGCRNIRKVAHGKFFRVILTEEGRVFFNGQNRKYMFSSGMDRHRHIDRFGEIENNFYRIEDGDKIVDLTAGKHYTAAVTERGKVYCGGYVFYRHFSDCRYNRESNEDYPFELRMPDGWRAKEAFGCERFNNVWVNCVNDAGDIKSFGAGQSTDLTGHGSGDRTSRFRELRVPEGIYMTKITNQGYIAHGIDNQQRLWVWGEHYAKDDSEGRAEMYEGDMQYRSTPMHVKWFTEQNMKVLDVASSYYCGIVKVRDAQEKIHFYGLIPHQDYKKEIGGADTLTPALRQYIHYINIDGAAVTDFAMGKAFSYFLLGDPKGETKSIHPKAPEEKGLIHFYQAEKEVEGEMVKEWKFLTPAEYEAQKANLPDLVFATRHPINWLTAKLEKEAADAAAKAEEEAKAAAAEEAKAAAEEAKAAGAEGEAAGEEAKADGAAASEAPAQEEAKAAAGETQAAADAAPAQEEAKAEEAKAEEAKAEESKAEVAPFVLTEEASTHFSAEAAAAKIVFCQARVRGWLSRLRAKRAPKPDPTLPDLAQVASQLVFDAQATHHSQILTNTEAGTLTRDKPLYVAKSLISGEETLVFATEAEALDGSQAWDMNPVIYYRLKSPVQELTNLPAINLKEHFNQRDAPEQVSFTIMNADINPAEVDAVQITDPKSVELFEAVKAFTPDQDLQLLRLLDGQLQSRNLNIYDCKPSQFEVTKEMLKPESTLHELDERALEMRASLLVKFSKAFSRALKYVSVDQRQEEGTISYNHYSSRHLVVTTAINQIVDRQLSSIPNGESPEVAVNRRKAMEFADAGNVDHEGKYSVFGQIISQLRERYPNMENFRHNSVDERCYRVKFKGEGSIDAGGPFRDSLVNIVGEMEDGLVPLLIKSPNNRNDHGANRDCFVLDPASTSPAHLEMFKYLGGFIGFGILSKSPVPLNLAPTVWKLILGERMQLSDLDSIDAYSAQVLTDLKNYSAHLSDEEFEQTVDQTFTTVLSNGEEVSLCPGGGARRVTKADIDEFIDLVVKARFSECDVQIKAIQNGLDIVFKGNLGHISYLTHDAIEVRACGTKFIDTDRLKSITIYPNCDQNHEIVHRFWRVFESFSGEERALYLKFVWGRNRLPADLSKISRKHEVRLMSNMNENGFPQSHTCFNQLDLPYYRSDELCRKRLLQAAELCGGIDTDNNNFAED